MLTIYTLINCTIFDHLTITCCLCNYIYLCVIYNHNHYFLDTNQDSSLSCTAATGVIDLVSAPTTLTEISKLS